MLSDSCFEFCHAVCREGVSDDLYKRLIEEIRHYSREPFDYPKEVTQFLAAAVKEVRKPKQTRKMEEVSLFLMMALTMQAYDHGDHREAELPQTLRAIWANRPKSVN